MPAPRRNRKGSGKDEVKKTYSVDELCMKAEELIEQMQPELAEKFYIKALEMEPNNTHIMDDLATLLLDMDDFDRAKQLLTQSISLAPNENHAKYMQMGQISQGQTAIDLYTKGIQLMTKQKKEMEKAKVDQEEIHFLNQQIAAALCSCAEIFLTDECFAENAEQECARYLQEALNVDPENPETLQTFASFRISQQKNDEAFQYLQKGYSLWKEAEFEDRPSYEFRHTSAKLFLELGHPQTAAEIWEGLLEEDDNIAEVHYHLGLAYSEFDKQAALECLDQAKQLLAQTGCQDPELSKQIEEVIAKVKESNIPEQVEEENTKEEIDGDGEDEEEDETMDTT